jgi:hypothetical protein
MRWEGRIHNFGSDLPNITPLVRAGYLAMSGNGSDLAFFGTMGFGWGDITSDQGVVRQCCFGVTGANGDLVWRLQRDTAGVNCGGSSCYTFEICYTLGGYCGYSTLSMTVVSNWAAGASFSLVPGTDLAWLRWYPGVVSAGMVGNQLLNAISLPAPSNPSALLGDWEFESNLNDSSGNAAAWTVFSGTVSFETTPTYAPMCSAGAPQSDRAGSTIALSSASSQALDGGATLTLLWQQVAGVSPVPVRWTSAQTIATPTAILPQFGSYNFQLTVTDGSGQSSSCVVHDGAAPTDNNGVVLYPSGGLYSAANFFLGPLIQWGQNPWPWYDTSHQLAADTNRAALGPPAGNGQQVTVLSTALGATDTVLNVISNSWNSGNTGAAVLIGSEQILLGANVGSTQIAIWKRGYRGSTAAAAPSGMAVNAFYYWDWYDWNQGPGSGGCTVTNNSTTVTCSGAQFISGGGQYAICTAGGVASNGNYIVIWHPTDTAKTGRMMYQVTSCASDTQATLSLPWAQSGGGSGGGVDGAHPIPAGSSLQYSIATPFEAYWFDYQGDPRSLDYYDNVVAYYLLYLRSGIDLYLIAARQVADLFYYGPFVDQGYAVMYYSGGAGGPPARAQSQLGLWLRNNDSPQVDMTTGIERAVSWNLWEEAVVQPYYGGSVTLGDDREHAYNLAAIAYDLVLDKNTTTWNLSQIVPGQTSATYPQAALAALQGAVSPTGAWNLWYTAQLSNGLWPINANTGGQNGYGSCSNCVVTGGGTSTVALTNGSANVVGTGTAFNCTDSAIYQSPLNATGANGPTPGGNIWFWHSTPATFPSPGGGDSQGYAIASCTDATHLTLTAPYQGATCGACGYQIPSNGGGNQYTGWGALGYMMGLASRAMWYVYHALLGAGDGTNAAHALGLAQNANSWMLTHAYRSDTNGVNYGADFADCGYPVAASSFQCSQYDTITDSLGFSAEGPLSWFSAVNYNPSDSTSKATADALYNQMWAKPGTCPATGPCNSTVTSPTNYLTQFDPTVNGFMLSGTPPPPKWLGQYFGFGDYSSWPAIRLGGAAPSAALQFYVSFSLGSVANATKVVVTATGPNGAASSTTCTASPCSITVPRADQPSYSIQLQYQSASGAVLATSSLPVIESQ